MKCPICGNNERTTICQNCNYSFGIFEQSGRFTFEEKFAANGKDEKMPHVVATKGTVHDVSVITREKIEAIDSSKIIDGVKNVTQNVSASAFSKIEKINQSVSKNVVSGHNILAGFNSLASKKADINERAGILSVTEEKPVEDSNFVESANLQGKTEHEMCEAELSDSTNNSNYCDAQYIETITEEKATQAEESYQQIEKKETKEENAVSISKINKKGVLIASAILLIIIGLIITVKFIKNDDGNAANEREIVHSESIKDVASIDNNTSTENQISDVNLLTDEEPAKESEYIGIDAEHEEESEHTENIEEIAEEDTLQTEGLYQDEYSEVLYKYKKYEYFFTVGMNGYYADRLELTESEMDDYYENYSIQNAFGGIWYGFYDVNGDGSEELLISDGESIIDMYSLYSSGIFRPFISNSLGYRERLHILNDGSIICEGSGSWSNCSFDVYRLSPDEPLVVREYGEYTDTVEDSYYNDYTYCTSQEQYYEDLDELLEKRVFDQIEWNYLCRFKYENRSECSSEKNIDKNILMTWLNEGITLEKIIADGYSLIPTFEFFGAGGIYQISKHMVTYYLGNTDVKLLFFDVDLPKGTCYEDVYHNDDNITEFHLVGLESPAEYIIPDEIGKVTRAFIEEGDLFVPNCGWLTTGSYDWTWPEWFPQYYNLTSYSPDDYITNDTLIGVLSSKQCGEDVINYNYSYLLEKYYSYSNNG